MARHWPVGKLDIGLSNPRYNNEKEKRIFLKQLREAKKQYEFDSLSPEAKQLWNQMFNK